MATDDQPRDARGSGEGRDDDPRNDMPNGRDLSEARRHGLPERGFDAGTGYGGAGSASAYSAKSSYGGQSGIGGSRMLGAYAGEPYGRFDTPEAARRAVRAEDRTGDRGEERSGVPGRDTGRTGERGEESASAAPPGVDLPRGTDEHWESERQASEERISERDGRRIAEGLDADGPLGGERRDELH